ncbi:MAG: hypothetical protein LUG21_07515 [Clostridiales bacterium]|nr:hypothetical protein [Clostridiales bacterium]
MKKSLRILFAVIITAVSLCSCTGNTNAQTDAVPDTSAYVPVGSVCFEWDSYKIYSGYENPTEPEPETTDGKTETTENTDTVPDAQENKNRPGLFDCSEENPRFIADVPGLEQFSISQQYDRFYTWETTEAQNQESTDANGYGVRKYDYTLKCYSLSLPYVDRPDFTPLQWSTTIYGIDKITDRLWWDDTTLFVRTEREYLGEGRPNPEYQHAYAISLSGHGKCAAFEEISESDIPYDIPKIDLNVVEQKIRSNCNAKDGIIGSGPHRDFSGNSEFTANGQLRKLNIPLYIYKGRKDYNDYWFLSEAEVIATPLGSLIFSWDYVDEEAPFYKSKSYEEYAVHKTDPLENWGIKNLTQTLSEIKQLCEHADEVFSHVKKMPLYYTMYIDTKPNSVDEPGAAYENSIQNGTLQSFQLSASGLRRTKSNTDIFAPGIFILPQYPKDTIDAKDIYTTNIPSAQQTDCAYPIQIEINAE